MLIFEKRKFNMVRIDKSCIYVPLEYIGENISFTEKGKNIKGTGYTADGKVVGPLNGEGLVSHKGHCKEGIEYDIYWWNPKIGYECIGSTYYGNIPSVSNQSSKSNNSTSSYENTRSSSASMGIFQFLFSFRGRISRSALWLKFILPYMIINILAIAYDIDSGTFNKEFGIGFVSGILFVIAIYPSLAVYVKRCHDRNRSGWFLFIGLIPILNIWLFIECLFIKGTRGSNKYGGDPLQ